MCGIAGIINFSKKPIFKEEIKKLTDLMVHRGPDGEGFFCENNIGLGHRRLSIIDLSEDGRQPMTFDDKYVITYNGEIYNYLEIKEELSKKGYVFKTKTDTEVLLAAYDYYQEGCLDHFNGMWSFVIYDKTRNRLFCSRDRFGIKPFYYHLDENRFVFASEIKPILSLMPSADVNKRILMDFLVMNLTDHTEDTFFEGIKTLRGSHYLLIDLTNFGRTFKKYYDIAFFGETGKLNLEAATELYRAEFERSVTWRLRSDVKVGTCLSGGLDSSYIAAVASEKYHLESDERFNAITAESLDPVYNEREYAGIVVDHLNLKWHVTSPTKDDFRENIYELVRNQEEPFGSPSVFLQNRVMKKAREAGVTVLLDGQGADETVLGYPRYLGPYTAGLPLYQRIRFLSKVSKNYGLSIGYVILNHYYFSNYLVRRSRLLLRLRNLNKGYRNLIDFSTLKDLTKSSGNLFELQKMEVLRTQIPQLLKWEDKNSMAYSIETRLPFLDFRLVETGLSIRDEHKLSHSWSKFIIRKAMENLLPASIVWRTRKVGFTAPTKDWMSDSFLREDVEKSPLLNSIFNHSVKIPKDVNLYWRMCNIALWEQIYQVRF